MKIVYLLIPFIFLSCFDKVSENQKDDDEKIHSIDSTEIDFPVKENLAFIQPCEELQKFVKEIEKLNWVSDTARINSKRIYSELNAEKINYFNGSPFYHIEFENSRINKFFTINIEFPEMIFDSIHYELFKSVEIIFGYYYRDKNNSNWISDGVIEQWQFQDETLAQKALEEIKKNGSIIYFNTKPYFCRLRNNLIIFQTRASAFSYDQKHVFKKFVEDNTPIIIQ
jgi:hypothetical protein